MRLRPLRPGDRVGLGEMFQRSSDRAVRQRFFTSSRDAVADYLDTVTSGSLRDHCSVVALVDECVVGLAEYQPIGSARAEIACFVDEDHHHSGVGELLVGHLARLARHHGVRTLEADVLSDNTVAARALRGCGLPEQRRHHPGTIHIRLDLTETPASPVSSGTERAGTE